eukprot:9422904-Alexandrium_andersonii.AAC.1
MSASRQRSLRSALSARADHRGHALPELGARATVRFGRMGRHLAPARHVRWGLGSRRGRRSIRHGARSRALRRHAGP